MHNLEKKQWLEMLLSNKSLIAQIAKKTKKCNFKNNHVSVYKGQTNQYVISEIQNGWSTKSFEFSFYEPHTKKQVETEIKEYLFYCLVND